MKRTAAAFAALSAISLSAAISGVVAPPAMAEGKTYKIYLSNNFVGNDWRQQMLRIAETVVKKPPLLGRVDLKIENVETTTQAQINSLNNIIRTKPDAILVDAGSPTALNPTLEKACAAGILVISFDQVVTADCAYKVESDWNMLPAVQAEWIAEKIGGKGKVFVDGAERYVQSGDIVLTQRGDVHDFVEVYEPVRGFFTTAGVGPDGSSGHIDGVAHPVPAAPLPADFPAR